MFKIIVSVFLLVVLGCTSIKTSELGNREVVDKQVAIARFNELGPWMAKKVGPNDPMGLNAARNLKPNWRNPERHIHKAAEIYVYLNDFQQCEPKAIEYMSNVLLGRRFALPGVERIEYLGRPKTQLERLLEATLRRAGGICSSFIEDSFKEAENKLPANDKKLLYEYITSDMFESGKSHRLVRKLTNNVLKDEKLSKKLSKYDKEKLHAFFKDKITEYFIRPCQRYVDNMSAFMRTINGLGYLLEHSEQTLFDKPSKDLMDSRSRYYLCQSLDQGWITIKADLFAPL